MTLTKQEFDLLIEAVQTWESNAGSLVGSIFSAILGPKPDAPGYEQYVQQREDDNRQVKDESKRRAERGVMLRAKLIQMRDSMEAAEFVDAART